MLCRRKLVSSKQNKHEESRRNQSEEEGNLVYHESYEEFFEASNQIHATVALKNGTNHHNIKAPNCTPKDLDKF